MFYFLKLKIKLGFFVAQMLKKITSEEPLRDNSTAELDALKHRDWVRQKHPQDHAAAFEPSERGSLCVRVRAHLAAAAVCFPGTSVGAADEGAPAGSEAEEGAGAALQHAAHRVQPHAL